MAIVVGSLSIATVGFPPTLFLAGVWAYGAFVNRFVPALSGPVSWVVGIIVESSLVTAESGLLALLAPHAHAQWIYVFALVAPLVLVGAAYVGLTRERWVNSILTRNQLRDDAVSGEPVFAFLVVVLVEAMFEAIKLHGHNFGLTWFMTGDARNQVVGTRQVLAAGGITLKEMRSYPALVNAICAVFDGAGGRSNLSAAILMVRDVQAMVATVVLICIGVSLCFIAAVTETFTRAQRDARRLPIFLVIPLGACGSISIGALFLGLGSSGGFLSAMGALVFAVASMVLGMRIVREYDNVTLLALCASLFLAVGSWTFLGVVPALALLVGIASGARRLRQLHRSRASSGERRFTTLTLAFSALCVLGVVGALLVNGVTIVAQLKSPGGIVAPNPRIFDWLGIAVVAAVAIAPGAQQRLVRLLVLGEFVVLALVVVWMYSMHPGGVSWSYYATKMIWLATCSVVWIPFVLLIDVMTRAERVVRRVGPRAVTQVALAAVGSSSVLWGVSHETPYPFPWHWAFVGSTFPTPMIIQKVIDESNTGVPFVFWAYSSPADDKLGDFWSALTWDYSANGTVKPIHSGVDFPTWASAQQGSLPELCQIVSEYRLRIVTKNPSLIPTLLSTCRGYLPIPSQSRR
jgi:hypothetical protein